VRLIHSPKRPLLRVWLLLLLLECSENPPPEVAEGGNEAPPGGLTDADIDSNWDETIETFDGLNLPEELLRGIYAYGFEKLSAIQQSAIKPTMLGGDLIAQVQSGTVRYFVVSSMCKE